MSFKSIEEFKIKKCKFLDNYYSAINSEEYDLANKWLSEIEKIDREFREKCGVDNYGKE